MGCDGGTIPRRDELVRLKKKPEQKDKEAELAYRWRHCAITQQPLQEPIVMCGLGRLYSKQNVIEHLLEKDKMPESTKHIKSLKDIKDLSLSPNPSYVDCDKTEGLLDVRSAPYICKLIGLEMTGKFRFVALWTCGCVFSERALKEIKSNICSLCQKQFSEQDVVILNGTDDEMNLMVSKMEARNARIKADKKDKKAAKKNTATVTATITSNSESSAAIPTIISAIKIENLMPPATSSKVVATTTTKSTIGKHVKPFLKRESTNEVLTDPAIKKLKDNSFSVAADPKATDVYKSLFTSHKSEQEQTRALRSPNTAK